MRLSYLLAALTASQALALRSDELRGGAPVLPLGLFRHLERQQQIQDDASSLVQTNEQIVFGNSGKHKKHHDFEEHWFDQLVSHDPSVPPPVNGSATWRQRYWLDAQYYKPGGPVFLLDAGETSGANRLPFLKQGILQILAQATNGVGIVMEHRYYGHSFPVESLETDSYRYLTTMQHLQDMARFAKNVRRLPGLEKHDLSSDKVPWIVYGGSYAGACSALARKLFPDVFWGAIASSAVTEAIVSFWEYHDAIWEHAPKKCMDTLQNHTALIDTLLGYNQTILTKTLKTFFGMPNVTLDTDFVNAVSIPLGAWQARNWDHAVSTKRFDRFCEAILDEGDSETLATASLEPLVQATLPLLPSDPRKAFRSFAAYAQYIASNVSSLCPSDKSQDECFGVGEYKTGTSLDEASWKSWAYQFCTEWGYFMGGKDVPEGKPTIVSRLIGPEYTQQICSLAFPPGKLVQVPSEPNVTMINQYGALDFRYSRLAFIDGSADPWRPATPHSKRAPHRKDTLSEPFKMIKGGVHHWDENGFARHSDEPKRIRKIHEEEVTFVKHWLREWKHRHA